MAYVRIPDAVHEELLNWSRWCWLGEWPHPLPATHCGSLEAGYRAPPDWNPDDPPQPPAIRPNQRHAEIVQRVWESLTPPPVFDEHGRRICIDQAGEQAKLVLKAEYPGRGTSGRIEGKAVAAVRLNLPVWLYDERLMQAVRKVEAAFETKEKKNSVCQ